jgi:hypothetical protein
MHAPKRLLLLAGLILGLAALCTPLAGADTTGAIMFEPSSYNLGDINGQNSWMKTGPYDVEVASVASFPAAAGYGFSTQALRLSDSTTSGSFGDQTFSPGITKLAGEGDAMRIFHSRFRIGTTQATEQPGLHTSVSPDDGNGARMSYLRFEDQADGVHVYFDDVTNPGPVGHESSWSETDIATLNRSSAHSIEFSINFNPGPHNDTVKIYVDGTRRITGSSWEDYYRYDAEQIGNGNVLSPISKMLFRESGTANPSNLGQGFLVDGLSVSSLSTFGNNSALTVSGLARSAR